jgi:alpha-1,3-mannosyltransferase
MHRVAALSKLRNMALAPLLRDHAHYSPDVVIVFINDVALCPQDILELLYQHKFQNAAMTYAFDWIDDGEAFYDVWVSRSLGADNIFFEITQDGSWAYKGNLFWDDPLSKAKFERLQPLQVYSCWGGMVVLDAKPFTEGKLAFRSSFEGECVMGEPTLLAKDMWNQGIGRILAVPSVNVGYDNEEGAKIKKRRGYVTDNVDTSRPPDEELVVWQSKPPPRIKCLPDWNEPSWVPPI